MRQRSRWRIAIFGIVFVVLVGGVWCAWQTVRVYRDLSAAASDAAGLQNAVERGDSAAAELAVGQLTKHSGRAARRTSGITWSMLSHVPVIGDDVHGVRVASHALSALSLGGIEPLITTADNIESLLPSGGRVPVERFAALQAPVAQGSATFDAAARELSAESPSDFIGPLEVKYRDLTRRVTEAARILRITDKALSVMPGMLGADGSRSYLLVFQNNAEVRATGGLPGAVSLLQTDDGTVTLSRQVAASSFGETPTSVLPLTDAERQIYGQQLGTYFLDANFTPDFPRSAALMKARWEQEYPDKLDGVLSVDPVALSYVLAATGPIQVGDLSLTADNAVDQLMNQVYLDNPDPVAQDEFFRTVAQAVFARVLDGVGSPRDLLAGLSRAAGEHRLYVHLFDAGQQTLKDTAVAGELTSGPAINPEMGLFLNDATGAKMSYYLRNEADATATYCSNGVQGLAGSAVLRSLAPAGGAGLPAYITGGGQYGTDIGSQLIIARLYAPVGGALTKVLLQGMPVDFDVVEQDGRPVASIVVELGPGEVVDLTWQMTTGPGQTGDLTFNVTPGIEPKAASSVAPSACP